MNTSPFKSVNGVWLTRGMFADIQRATHGPDFDASDCMYWLNENLDNDDRPILRELFIELNDITGIKMARQYLGGKLHLKYLLEKADWFKEALDIWREELSDLYKAQAMEVLNDAVLSGSVPAAKFMATEEHSRSKEAPKRGRPSKEELDDNVKRAVKKLTETEEDYNRMIGKANLKIINGGKK